MKNLEIGMKIRNISGIYDGLKGRIIRINEDSRDVWCELDVPEDYVEREDLEEQMSEFIGFNVKIEDMLLDCAIVLFDDMEILEDNFFFKMKIYHHREDRQIGVKVGFVKAKTLKEAEEIAWKSYGTERASGIEIWRVCDDKECFNVYFSGK